MLVPEPIYQKAELIKQAIDACSPSFTQMLAHKFVSSGAVYDYIEPYVKNIKYVLKPWYLPAQHLPQEITFTAPRGGFYIWLDLPKHIDSTEVLKRMNTCWRRFSTEYLILHQGRGVHMADMEPKLGWEDVPEPEGRELAAWVFWNSVPGFGSRSFLRMLEKYGSAVEGLEGARRGGKPPAYTRRAPWNWAGRTSDPVKMGMDEIARASRIRARIIPCPSPLYPPPLRKIHDPPILLYAVGNRGLTEVPWVAMVGSRQATAYRGCDCKKIWAFACFCRHRRSEWASPGIDAAAHRGALRRRPYCRGSWGRTGG